MRFVDFTAIRVATLLLLPFAASQDCFCPGGASVPDPSKVVQLSASTSTTCGSLESEASKSYLVRTYGCQYYQYYAQICGCDQPEEPIQACHLCQDESDPFISVQRSIEQSECRQYATEAKYDPFRLGCGYYNFLGSLCGCVKNRPPFEGCTLCADGSEPPLASLEVRVPGVEEGTCEHVNAYTRYLQEPGTSECLASQATLGTFCGCDQSSQPTSGCPICLEKGKELSNEDAPDYSYLSPNGNTQIHQRGQSCLQAEMMAHQLSETESGDEICSSIREQISEECCVAPPVTQSVSAESSQSQQNSESAAPPGVDFAPSKAIGPAWGAAVLGSAVLGLWQLVMV